VAYLEESIREEKALTYSIHAHPIIKLFPKNQYAINIFFSSSPDTVDYIVNEVKNIANSLKDPKNISDLDLQKTIEKIKKEFETNLRKNPYWLNELVKYEQMGKQPDFNSKYKEIVASLSKEKIANAAKKFLNNDRYIIISLLPEQEKK